jgi:hypothetical protein
MEQHAGPFVLPLSEAPEAKKLPYAPPKAAFVPLMMEERLLMIGYVPGICNIVPVVPPNCQPL